MASCVITIMSDSSSSESDGASFGLDLPFWTHVIPSRDHTKIGLNMMYPAEDAPDGMLRKGRDVCADLKDLVLKVKISFGLKDPVTESELKEFIIMVYGEGFRSHLPHSPPDEDETKPRFITTSVCAGKLIRDLPLPANKPGAGVAKAHAARDRAEKSKLMGDAIGKQQDKWRRKGAPIYLRATVPKHGHSLVIELYDRKGRVARGDESYVKYRQAKSLLYQYAVSQHQVFQDTVIHRYNMRLAIFYARNRITAWGNGRPVGSRPKTEDMKHFMAIKSINKLVVDIHDPHVMQAIQSSKGADRPGLFDTI